MAWDIVWNFENDAVKRDFKTRANNQANLLQSGIDQHLEKLVALRTFLTASDEVTRNEFKSFADGILASTPGISNIAWAPRVTNAERAEHEQAAAATGLTNYRIADVIGQGGLVSSPERPDYFPKFFISTFADASRVYGIDLGQPVRRGSLDRGRDAGALAASPVFKLVTGTGDRQGFFVVGPVYRRDLPHDTVDARRQNLTGFVQGTFLIADLANSIFNTQKSPIDAYLFATSDPDALPIYVHSSGFRADQVQPRPWSAVTTGRHWIGEIKVADVRWTLVLTPLPGWSTATHASAWILLVAGLALTGLVTAYLWKSGRGRLALEIANREIATLADTDALTGLANGRVFLDGLVQACAANRRAADPFAVLMLDLDRFKHVNDTLGHPAGDALLREVAKRLSKAVRETDLVGRLGGDEFAILQAGVADAADAGALAARIAAELAAPCRIGDRDLNLTSSIGIAVSSSEALTADEMMVRADLALYRAKDDGRNCYRFHAAELDQRVHERVVLAEDLRHGIDRGELELYYQPQVETGTGRISGLEALARWNHPQRGLVPPSVFIPVAESTGSIVALGRWVIAEACRQIRSWRDQGLSTPVVAINVSALQLREGSHLGLDIATSLARWEVDPAALEIELTETVLLDATKQHNRQLEQLRGLGVRIAIDDFGTGYSSLKYLTTFPVDRLKIAQELVLPLTTDDRCAAVVRAAIDLGHSLGVEVLAEGVETEAHVAFLVAAGCEQSQGYHFSRPLTAARAGDQLRHACLQPAVLDLSTGFGPSQTVSACADSDLFCRLKA